LSKKYLSYEKYDVHHADCVDYWRTKFFNRKLKCSIEKFQESMFKFCWKVWNTLFFINTDKVDRLVTDSHFKLVIASQCIAPFIQ
jgi:hypothetical protein